MGRKKTVNFDKLSRQMFGSCYFLGNLIILSSNKNLASNFKEDLNSYQREAIVFIELC